MKITLVLLGIAALVFAGFRSIQSKNRALLVSRTPTDFFALGYADIHGKEVKMEEYRGKYVLCVNVASKCGNTPQYKALQTLYEKNKDKLVVIGFPCNQFLGQEPGSEEEIESFCSSNYGITFPLASKIDVKGKAQHPIYTWLTSKESNGVSDASVEWNFHKFLVSPEGKWLQSYAASLDPLDPEIQAAIR